MFSSPSFLCARASLRDADYRHPLAEKNAGQYVTLQKDLGGFNNIRLSLESGVAFAAATGRTFVIPPPFTIWNMNAKVKKKVRCGVVWRSVFIFPPSSVPFRSISTTRNERYVLYVVGSVTKGNTSDADVWQVAFSGVL